MQMRPNGMKLLVKAQGLSCCQNLQYLNLSHNQLGALGVKILSDALDGISFASLGHLKLTGNDIATVGLLQLECRSQPIM